MTQQGISALTYPVRGKVIVRYLGQLCGVVALLNLVPLVVTLGFGEWALGGRYLLVTAILMAATGLALRLPTPNRLQANEALVITVMAFLLGALAALYPFMDAGLSWPDALFEAVSGVTTTGLSTLTTVAEKSRGFLFARAWLQWYCGLAIAILSLVLIMGPGAPTRRLAAAGGDMNDILGTSRGYARRIITVYALLTVFGIVLTLATGQDLFNATVHILCAVSTAGFSSFNDSLASLDGWAPRVAVLTSCLAGAVPMALYYQAWRHGWRQLIIDREVQVLLSAILVFTLLLWMNLYFNHHLSPGTALAHAAATATSAQTSTGFTTFELTSLDAYSKLLLILSMFLGGGMGSTAGGIKLVRLVILLKLVQIMIRRAALPRHAVVTARLNGHRLEDDESHRALLVILLYGMAIVFSWFPFLAYGYDPLDALFEVVSATGTVGLSVGITASGLEPLLKGVLCLDMLLGRVEILALLVLCHPMTWFVTREEIT